MERQSRSRGTAMLKYLQKAATFSLNSRPPSTHGGGGDRRPAARGFSGPIAPIVPTSLRHKKSSDPGVAGEEPSSPKITCTGQIKLKEKAATEGDRTAKAKAGRKKKAPSAVARAFGQKVRPGTEKEAGREQSSPETAAAPSLGLMRKFASGRETLSAFDWKMTEAGDNSEDDGMNQ